jgi:hypothetical protein
MTEEAKKELMRRRLVYLCIVRSRVLPHRVIMKREHEELGA